MAALGPQPTQPAARVLMVFFFSSVTAAGTFSLYMGRDKFENEELIAHGWPEDVWFHVDDLSSAHVYVRLPAELLADCAQLVKANSIEGNKKTTGRVRIVYTPWANLLKTGAMSIGQVGFKQAADVLYTDVDKRDNAIVNRLMKTRQEQDSAVIRSSREERDAQQRKREKDEKRRQAEEERRSIEQHRKDKEARSYETVFQSDSMTSNAHVKMAAEQYEDDFM